MSKSTNSIYINMHNGRSIFKNAVSLTIARDLPTPIAAGFCWMPPDLPLPEASMMSMADLAASECLDHVGVGAQRQRVRWVRGHSYDVGSWWLSANNGGLSRVFLYAYI